MTPFVLGALLRVPDATVPAPAGAVDRLCERLRADDRGAAIPVILLTANFITADQEVARRAGADDFVVKPFDPCELMTRVKELVRARR